MPVNFLLFLGGVIAAYILYRFFTALFRTPPADKKTLSSPADNESRRAALANFKEIHQAARDERKKIAHVIATDTDKAVEIMRKLMQQK